MEEPMDARYISCDHEIMSGVLCFNGTRVPVQNLFDYLEGTSSLEEFLQDFPSVSRSLSDIRKHGKFGAHIWLRINDLDSASVI
jgi:uncharacterized protein (DUF433 family)